jgi:Lar family restriction alleviation protein
VEGVSKEELKNCPFCGSEANLYDIDELYTAHEPGLVEFRVLCSRCSATTEVDGGYQTEEDAIADWNRRATDTAPLYYVLRRTVGKTTLHYEYARILSDEGDLFIGWHTRQNFAFMFATLEEIKATQANHGGEILPVRLLLGESE